MRQYRQLTEDDRIEIYAMKQAGKTQRAIGEHLGVHPGTISRELARNTGQRGYRPKQAHRWTSERRRNGRKAVKMTPETVAYIEGQRRITTTARGSRERGENGRGAMWLNLLSRIGIAL